MAMRGARLEVVRALHPERVFRLQFRQIAGEGRRRIRRRQEPDHFEKERRLRSSEVVGARSVRRMAVCVNQIGEVLRHVLEEILSAAFSEAEHGEIRVPVIKLTESAARHDIRPRQRQQRGIGRHGRLVAGQQRPQGVDVPADGDLFRRRLRCRGLGRQLEMRDDEALQPLERIRLLGMIERQNLGRRRLWRRVGELLAVGENVLKLDVRVEVAEQDLRRRGPLERKRRMRDEENRRDERRARCVCSCRAPLTLSGAPLRRSEPALHRH